MPRCPRYDGLLDRSIASSFLETLAVAPDSGNGERLAFALKGEIAIVIFDTAVQIEPIPLLRVTDVVEGNIELWSRKKVRRRTARADRVCCGPRFVPGVELRPILFGGGGR